MKKIACFLIIFLSLLYANISSAESWQNCRANEGRTAIIQEELYAIGFSGDRRSFAYLKQGYEEGVGSYYWQFTIQDLATDKIIERIELIATREKQKHPPPEFLQTTEKLLKSYSIKVLETPEFAQFPAESNGSLINAFIINSSRNEGNGIRVKNMDLFLANRSFDFKRIGHVSEINHFGHTKRFGHKIVGYIAAPNNDKMVVSVAFKNKENEESVVICAFALFRANSRINEQARKNKIDFIENAIATIPEQADAYLELGDNYWLSEKPEKANKAYQSYIRLMRASGRKDKIPVRAFKRSGCPR